MGNSHKKLAPEIVKVKISLCYQVGKPSESTLNAMIYNIRAWSIQFRNLSSDEKVQNRKLDAILFSEGHAILLSTGKSNASTSERLTPSLCQGLWVGDFLWVLDGALMKDCTKMWGTSVAQRILQKRGYTGKLILITTGGYRGHISRGQDSFSVMPSAVAQG